MPLINPLGSIRPHRCCSRGFGTNPLSRALFSLKILHEGEEQSGANLGWGHGGRRAGGIWDVPARWPPQGEQEEAWKCGGGGGPVPPPAGSFRTQRAAGAVTSLERHWRRVAPSAALEFSVSLPRSIIQKKKGFPPFCSARQSLGGGGQRGCWDRPGRWEAPLDAAGRELGELLAANRESLERGSMAQGRRHASGRVREGTGGLTQQLQALPAPIATDRDAVAAKRAGVCREISIVLPYAGNVAPLSLTIMPGGEVDALACTKGRLFWPELPCPCR